MFKFLQNKYRFPFLLYPFPIPHSHTCRPYLPPHHQLALPPRASAVVVATPMAVWVVATIIITTMAFQHPPLPLVLTLVASPSVSTLSPLASSSTCTPRLAVRRQEVGVVEERVGLGVWLEVWHRLSQTWIVRHQSTRWTWRGRSFPGETPCWRC